MYPIKLIGEFATVRGGKRVPKDHDFVNSKTIHPYIRARDIRGGKIKSDDLVYISSETYEKIKKYTVNYNDVCLTIAGNIGDVGIIPYSLAGANLTENAIKLIHLQNCDPNYLKFCLLHPDVQEQMKLLAAGAAQPKLGIYKVQSVALPFPSISIQRKIAGILSAYDDLIENNSRRIQILEEMAQTIYQEWFVHFRFPGNENVRIVDSGTELGMIPEEWEIKNLKSICDYIGRGISPIYDDNAENIVINQRCIRNNKINFEYARKNSKFVSEIKKIKFGDVLINSTGVGTLGRLAQVYTDLQNCTVDSHVSIVRPSTNIDIDYFGQMLINNQPYFESLGVGSTGQIELNRARIQESYIFYPPLDLQHDFSNQVRPMQQLIMNLLNRNNILQNSRDLLLPELISGEIDVSDLQITVIEE